MVKVRSPEWLNQNGYCETISLRYASNGTGRYPSANNLNLSLSLFIKILEAGSHICMFYAQKCYYLFLTAAQPPSFTSTTPSQTTTSPGKQGA